jgi:hypothetical protein
MKNSIFSIAFFAMFLLAFSACQQERTLDEFASVAESSLPGQTAQRMAPTPKLNASFNIDFDRGVCMNGKMWATPIDPQDLRNAYKYATSAYQVEWFKNNQLIHSGPTLPCTCGILVKVVVTSVQTGYQTSRLLYTGPCPEGRVEAIEYHDMN